MESRPFTVKHNASALENTSVYTLSVTPSVCFIATPGGSAVRNTLAMQQTQETRIRSLGWKDPLEKEMTIHSNILAWRIPWTEVPCGLQSMGSQRVGHG